MKLMRQNTAALVHIGPLINSSGGALNSAITIGTGVLELFQNGATSPIDLSTRTWALNSNGVYDLTLFASDVSVPGPMEIHCHATGIVPLMTYFNVLTPAAYDALCAGGDMLANLHSVNGNAQAAANIGQSAQGIAPITVGNGSTPNLVQTNLTNAISGFFNGRTIIFVTGSLQGQAATITAYNGITKQITVNALTGAPSNGDLAVIV